VSTTTLGAARVREVLDRHGVTPARALGQNFVIDPNTVRKVVALAGLTGSEHVLEVGAGVGSLTVALAATADRVTAIEVDHRLLPVLAEVLEENSNVTVLRGDALRLDLGATGANRLVANLPYSIATPLVMKVLTEAFGVSALTVMTQREVGERLAAAPGSKTYGQASVLVAYHAVAEVVAAVSRRAFYPIPRVDSVIVRIVRREKVARVDFESLAVVVRAAFSQRRKTLRNALAATTGSVGAATDVLVEAGVAAGLRAEQVDLEGFVAIARALRRT
jgi:16S rRNA (adenine1518-N6/adenine1519-N6)-dimethyltransferase